MKLGETATAYLGFGGNIGRVKPRILAAWELIGRSPIIKLAECSKLYRTAPVGGPPGQGDYVNAVCRVETDISPRELLAHCLDIESVFGRERRERWGPRTLDIDLLLYGDLAIDEQALYVPHPRLRERLFALVPLCDVAPLQLKLPPDERVLVDVLADALSAAGESIQDWQHRVIE